MPKEYEKKKKEMADKEAKKYAEMKIYKGKRPKDGTLQISIGKGYGKM